MRRDERTAHCSLLPTKVMSWSTVGRTDGVTSPAPCAQLMSRRRPIRGLRLGSFTGAGVGVWVRSPSSLSARAVSERATRTKRDLSCHGSSDKSSEVSESGVWGREPFELSVRASGQRARHTNGARLVRHGSIGRVERDEWCQGVWGRSPLRMSASARAVQRARHTNGARPCPSRFNRTSRARECVGGLGAKPLRI